MLARGQRKTPGGALVTPWSLQTCCPWPGAGGASLWDGPPSPLPCRRISPRLGHTCKAKAVQGVGATEHWRCSSGVPAQARRRGGGGSGLRGGPHALREQEPPGAPRSGARQAGRSKNTTKCKKQTRE